MFLNIKLNDRKLSKFTIMPLFEISFILEEIKYIILCNIKTNWTFFFPFHFPLGISFEILHINIKYEGLI